MAAQIKRCREPFATEVDGMTRVIAAGQLVSTDDPAYTKGTAAHFEDIETHVAAATVKRAAAAGKGSGVEQATAGPGEKRDVTPATGPGPFDPSAATVKDVLAYLDGVGNEAEARRVLDAEQAGQARAGILKQRDEILARHTD
jgi:hypothetical protein